MNSFVIVMFCSCHIFHHLQFYGNMIITYSNILNKKSTMFKLLTIDYSTDFLFCPFLFSSILFLFLYVFRKMGWRLGLQAVTVLVSCSFFMGLLYRPASLYHPQRRAILHLKNQRKKVNSFYDPYFPLIESFLRRSFVSLCICVICCTKDFYFFC